MVFDSDPKKNDRLHRQGAEEATVADQIISDMAPGAREVNRVEGLSNQKYSQLRTSVRGGQQ